MKHVVLVLLTLVSVSAVADSYAVDGKTFDNKPQAIKYVIASGKRLEVTETRCLILTNKLSLKACPKNKKSSFDNEQFQGLSATK